MNWALVLNRADGPRANIFSGFFAGNISDFSLKFIRLSRRFGFRGVIPLIAVDLPVIITLRNSWSGGSYF